MTELENRVLKLEPKDRVRLVQLLLESLQGISQGISDEEVAAIRESARRLALQRSVEDAEREIAAGEWGDGPEISARLKCWAGSES